jgi:hypothetical protein
MATSRPPIFLTKNLLGYRDAVANEVSGPDGRPIPIESGRNLSNLSDEELEQLKNFCEKAQPKPDKCRGHKRSELRFLLSPSVIEAELRRCRATFVTLFADSGPLGREFYQKHLEFFATGPSTRARVHDISFVAPY